MLSLTKESDYAIQFLGELAKNSPGKPVSLQKFSQKSGISFLFLQKIARSLKKAELICAVHGQTGGYTLQKPVENISLKDIVEAVEGPTAVVPCLRSKSLCSLAPVCTKRMKYHTINKKIQSVLLNMSLKDFIYA